MKYILSILLALLSLPAFAQYGGGNGSGYTSGTGGGTGVCQSSATIVYHGCDNYTLPSGSQNVTQAGTYLDTIPNLAGCDSLLTIHLTLGYSTSRIITATYCDSADINGTVYTSSGTYTQFLTNAQGCDSVLSIHLSVFHSSASSLTQTACQSYTFHGQTYTSSGTFTQTILNGANCDSVVTLHLTILPLDATVNVIGGTVMAQQAGATYQWLDCNNGMAPITGATSQSFTPVNAGNYAVRLSLGNCSDTSACVAVIGTAVAGSLGAEGIRIYPNPTHGRVQVKLGMRVMAGEIVISDLRGQLVARQPISYADQAELSLVGAAGTYIVSVYAEGYAPQHFRVLKVD